MRRMTVLLASLVLVLTGLLAVPGPPASAADPLRGRVIDNVTGNPVGGVTMSLHRLTSGSGVGARIDRTTTSADGTFSLDAGDDPDEEFYVVLEAGELQGGVVGGAPAYVHPSAEYATTFGRGSRLGKIFALPAYIKGRLVDADTGRPVRKARVTARVSPRNGVVVAGDVTNKKGRFTVRPVACEGECVLHARGRPLGYENGFRACNAQIVATVGAACASPIGRIGRVFVESVASSRPLARGTGGRVVKPAKVGRARVGMTVKQAMATGQFNKNVPNEPCDPIKLQPKKPYNRQYVVFVARRKIVEMDVGGTKPVTPTGVRVGSTYRQVKRAYPGKVSAPEEVGYGQWGVYVHRGKEGPDRKWLGFLFGKAAVGDGPLQRTDRVTLMGVTKDERPPLLLDGC